MSARQQQRDLLAELYPFGDVPAYKAEGSAEFERSVDELTGMAELADVDVDVPRDAWPCTCGQPRACTSEVPVCCHSGECSRCQPATPAARAPRTRPGPNLAHGLTLWTDPGDDEYFRRLDLSRAGQPLLPGFTAADQRGTDQAMDPRDARRARIVLTDALSEHAERHWFYLHPFCELCSPNAVSALTRWLVLNPGRTPRDTWDGVTLAETPPASVQGQRSPYLTLRELRALPPAEWLCEEIIPQGSVGYLTGRDGTYKTFLGLDLALHIVTMRSDWNDRPISWNGYGRVLFIAGEGARSFPKRIDAWLAHHGEELPPYLEDNLVVRNGAVDLYAGADAFRELVAVVREQQPDLIVVDTLNRSSGSADQNAASDMSVITQRIAALKAAAGPDCTVIVIAHTTKADTDARGSSAIEDDADFVLHCKKDEDRLSLTVAKQKDGESGQTIELRALPVDESLVLVEAAPEPSWLSDNLAERIVGVLFAVRDGDAPTSAQVLALVKDDGTGKPAGKTQVNTVLGDLKRSGRVTAEKLGKGAAAPQRYRLAASEYPSDVTS